MDSTEQRAEAAPARLRWPLTTLHAPAKKLHRHPTPRRLTRPSTSLKPRPICIGPASNVVGRQGTEKGPANYVVGTLPDLDRSPTQRRRKAGIGERVGKKRRRDPDRSAKARQPTSSAPRPSWISHPPDAVPTLTDLPRQPFHAVETLSPRLIPARNSILSQPHAPAPILPRKPT